MGSRWMMIDGQHAEHMRALGYFLHWAVAFLVELMGCAANGPARFTTASACWVPEEHAAQLGHRPVWRLGHGSLNYWPE
jgi:hypothetical protein